MAGFSWNTAAVGGAVSTVSNWIGGAIATKLALASAHWLDTPMPTEVQMAVTALIGGALVAGAVYVTPDKGYVYSPPTPAPKPQPTLEQPPATVTSAN